MSKTGVIFDGLLTVVSFTVCSGPGYKDIGVEIECAIFSKHFTYEWCKKAYGTHDWLKVADMYQSH